jgi:subtilisin-like proprotein convertase family protein
MVNAISKCLYSAFFLFLLINASGQTSELFISEYAEGSSNNKYIEIYNGTGSAVNLSDYEIWRISNGGSWPEASLSLSGILADGSVYVVCNPSAASGINAASDLSNGIVSWNGDDAVGLAKNSILIDAVGEDGLDPGSGWAVAGTPNATTNGKLIRKSNICSPNTNWDNSRGTNASNSEWIVTSYSADLSTIGGHSTTCTVITGPELQLENSSGGNETCGFTLDFGTLSPSSSQSLTFDIANIGTSNLVVSSLSVSGSTFSILSPSAPFTIVAGGSQEVIVQYSAPASSQINVETLTIASNDADEGTCTVDLIGESSNSIPIPDNGCPSSFATGTFSYSGGSLITDVDVFVSIMHTYRADIEIQLTSPEGTTVQFLDGVGGSALNLEVLFDDEAISSLSSSDHTLNGVEDETIQSTNESLNLFDGEDPNGIWTLSVCDNFANDVGSLEDWYPIIQTATNNPEPTNHPTAFNCTVQGSDQIDLNWTDASGGQTPAGYLIKWSDVSYAAIGDPTDGSTANGANSTTVA